MAEFEKVRARAEADQVQRERQQGLGRPILSLQDPASGQRLVFVKNRLMHSKGWVTFFDFLGAYITTAMGRDWANAEIAKPLEERHPILRWYQKLCDFQRTFMKEPAPGKVYSARGPGPSRPIIIWRTTCTSSITTPNCNRS